MKMVNQAGVRIGTIPKVVVLAHRAFSQNGKPNPVHLFDAGPAWENLVLQATTMGLGTMGLVVHGLGCSGMLVSLRGVRGREGGARSRIRSGLIAR
jgi:hypothetical protein